MGMNRSHKRQLKTTKLIKKENDNKKDRHVNLKKRRESSFPPGNNSGTGKRFMAIIENMHYKHAVDVGSNEEDPSTYISRIEREIAGDEIVKDRWTKSHHGKDLESWVHDQTRWKSAKKSVKKRKNQREYKEKCQDNIF
jgi:hypothetical protein